MTLLLIPGLLCDERLFAPQVKALADLGDVRVTRPARADTLDTMAREVLAEAPPGPLSIAGLSMGGYIAMAIMALAPHRVERLALLDTSHRAPDEARLAAGERWMAATRAGEFDRVLREEITPRYLRSTTPVGSELHELAVDMGRKLGPLTFLAQQKAMQARPERTALLRGFLGPALVLCGREDRVTPPDLHVEMAGLMPRADLVVIADAAHLPTLETPLIVNAALRRWMMRK